MSGLLVLSFLLAFTLSIKYCPDENIKNGMVRSFLPFSYIALFSVWIMCFLITSPIIAYRNAGFVGLLFITMMALVSIQAIKTLKREYKKYSLITKHLN